MLPPVTTAFGAVIVFDGLMMILSIGIPKLCEAACATFVFKPCPISIPPTVIETVASPWKIETIEWLVPKYPR